MRYARFSLARLSGSGALNGGCRTSSQGFHVERLEDGKTLLRHGMDMQMERD